jgi:hypothetical protein
VGGKAAAIPRLACKPSQQAAAPIASGHSCGTKPPLRDIFGMHEIVGYPPTRHRKAPIVSSIHASSLAKFRTFSSVHQANILS